MAADCPTAGLWRDGASPWYRCWCASGTLQVASSQHGACGLTILPIAQHDGLISADFSKGARTVPENVIVSHRGVRYEIGRGPGFYGIWPTGAAGFQPIEWWPETADGWNGAWSRFSEIESRRAVPTSGPKGGAWRAPHPALPPRPAPPGGRGFPPPALRRATRG